MSRLRVHDSSSHGEQIFRDALRFQMRPSESLCTVLALSEMRLEYRLGSVCGMSIMTMGPKGAIRFNRMSNKMGDFSVKNVQWRIEGIVRPESCMVSSRILRMPLNEIFPKFRISYHWTHDGSLGMPKQHRATKNVTMICHRNHLRLLPPRSMTRKPWCEVIERYYMVTPFFDPCQANLLSDNPLPLPAEGVWCKT
jgi:hypothetical protein